MDDTPTVHQSAAVLPQPSPMPLHRIINDSGQAVYCADGSLWEAGEEREQDPTEPSTARSISLGHLNDLGEVAHPAPAVEEEATEGDS